MRINSNDEMFGFPILKFREFFRRYTDNWSVEGLTHFFNIGKKEANSLLAKLEEADFIEKGSMFHNEQLWNNKIKGNALALASAAKPILRATADKKITEFIIRVKEVNANDYYLYKIKKVVVFGSYLRDVDTLGDIDLAIELVHREKDSNMFTKLANARSSEVKSNGRIFSNIVDEVYWPQTEVLKYLKSHSRSISIHFTDEPVLKNAKQKIIFQEE